jgi:hypothetical protein
MNDHWDENLKYVKSSGGEIFQKAYNHLKILGA